MSTEERLPNRLRHRIAALWREGMNVKGPCGPLAVRGGVSPLEQSQAEGQHYGSTRSNGNALERRSHA